MEIPIGVAVVCRSRGRIEALGHVVQLLAAYVDASAQWTLLRAVERGFVFLVRRLLRVDCSLFLARMATIRHAIRAAAGGGHVQTLAALADRYPQAVLDEIAVKSAATNGHLALLQWMHERIPVVETLRKVLYSSDIIALAAAFLDEKWTFPTHSQENV
ncbi:Secreted RxLR effector protein 124 [Phytophthora ramorum]|uniref:Secreted RxLR effector protein 124 n=1 Tax=Phytophthora ramorum TaxID=164328 RepID=UPI0030AA0DED|nr:Secreted RxLR effector protein 124 [Phytophthora ramorum]